MKKPFLCLLSLSLALLPCAADVIPTRYGKTSPIAQKTVKAQLVEQGLTTSDAQTRIDRLTSDELAFFSGNSASVQAAGSLYYYEWAIGATVLGIIASIGLSMHVARADQLK